MKTSLAPSSSTKRRALCSSGVAASLLVASLMAFGVQRVDAQTPREIVEQLQDLRYPKQIAAAQPLCTDAGWPMLVRMTANSHDFLRTFKIGEIKANPHLTDVQVVRDTVEGKSIFWVRLIEIDGVWKLNNIYVRKFNSLDINLWARFIYQHPDVLEKRLAADNSANTGDNLQRFNSATTAIGNVLDILIKLRDLSDHGNN